ncbi:hypothetical protein NQ315_004305 [Exocentrus adspersus]|uniref:Uncharacterized protein n=1 Tax=Exocentrus adspersus TaxID=1586481 RepID=A0AAV8W7R6_9CUCU|nr:hypothetical protein NQ315_004305 [Exocentrus adspersus]
MITTVVSTLLFSTLLVQNRVQAAVANERGKFDVRGNYITNRRHPLDSTCCLIPTCEGYNHCYQTINCGYTCTQGSYEPVDYGSTPGFNLRESFTKNDCHFGVCQNYKFLCNHCPDPREEEFNVHTVRKDCRDCYYKNS